MSSNTKVLIIDDDEASLDIFSRFFSKFGISTVTAHDGQEGIDKIQEGPFDLIFLDLNMPNMSGLEALPRIRDLDQNARIIITTAYASYETKVEAREQGAYDYLVKPVTLVKLKEIIEKTIPQQPQSQDVITDDGLAKVGLDVAKVDRDAVRLIPERLARAFFLVAVAKYEETLTVAMADPSDQVAIDTISAETGCKVITLQAERKDIMAAIQAGYGEPDDVAAPVAPVPKPAAPAPKPAAPAPKPAAPAPKPAAPAPKPAASITLENLDGDASKVSEIFERILSQAIQRKANAIYIEPHTTMVNVRLRIGETMHPVFRMPTRVCAPLIALIRKFTQAGSEGQCPPSQGRLRLRIHNATLTFSYHILTTVYGESVVIYPDEQREPIVDINDLGFDAVCRQFLLDDIRQPCGMIYITGPPDNGYMVTLYAVLQHLNATSKKIISLEGSMSRAIDGVTQVPVRFDLGQTYATAIRSILYHDPDVILIEETPDAETASLAVRTATSGHLVISTVHTPDTVSCITYLRNLGVQPFLLSRALNLVIAQYRIRQICQHCKIETAPSQEVLVRLTALGPPRIPAAFFTGAGCEHCEQTGYHGMAPIYECLPVTGGMKQAILHGADNAQLQKEAVATGCVSLLEAGLAGVTDGLITLEDFLSAVPHLHRG